MDDDLGPWIADPVRLTQPSAVHLIKPRVVVQRHRHSRVQKPSPPRTVHVSPVTFRSPEFHHFVPAHTWKPLTPCLSKTKADHFGLFNTKGLRPLSAASPPSFDLTTAKKALLKLTRGSARTNVKECTIQPPSTSLFSELPSRVTRVLDVVQPLPRFFKLRSTLSPPRHSYKRRIKHTDKDSCPDYDHLADNLNEMFTTLVRSRPKTSHFKFKTPCKTDPGQEFRATLQRIVASS